MAMFIKFEGNDITYDTIPNTETKRNFCLGSVVFKIEDYAKSIFLFFFYFKK